MTDESTNNDLNISNKDTFLQSNKKEGGVLTKSDIKRMDTRQTVMLQEKIEKKTLDDLGDIEEAKKHRSANRPLHKIKDFNSNVNFCRCCCLPCEEKGILEPFHFCDDPDKFAECGHGVSLYFYFIRFSALILFIGVFVMAISMMVFNHHYTKGINRVCNDFYVKYRRNDIKLCEGFITMANESLNEYIKFNDWILRFTTDNVEIYQLLYANFTNNETKNADDVSINYSVLNFFFLLTAFILNIFYIILIAAHTQKSRLLNQSIRDYTVLISNAKFILVEYFNEQQKSNPTFCRRSQLQEEKTDKFINYVNEYIRSDKSLIDLKINNINMCYDLSNYQELKDELEKCKKKIFKTKNDPKIISLNQKEGNQLEDRCYYSFPIPFIKCIHCKGKPLMTLEKQRSDLEKHVDMEIENMEEITEQKFTGYMFVSFNKIKDKETILKEYPNNFFDMIIYFIKNIKYYLFCCCLSEGEKRKFNKIKGIDVDDPPEPEDIYWFNFKYNARQRGIRILIVFLICLIIIAFSFGIILLFTYLQNGVIEKEKKMNLFVKYLLSFIITLVISGINLILEEVLTKLTLLEKHISRTNFYLSLSIKITIFTFFNSAIIPLLSKHLIVKSDENKLDKDLDNPLTYKYNLNRNMLVINDMLVLFLVNSILTPILWSVPYIIKRIQICFIERKPNNHHKTQRQLNKVYELPDMRITFKYSFLAKTLAMTLFYLPIFPLGFVISAIGFVLGYFLELYNFTHLYKRPEMLNEIITKVYADNFIIILFIGAVGDYFFFHDVFHDNKMSLANIIIFGVLIIVPYTKFITCNFVGIDKSEYHDYALSEVYFTFFSDYERQNPLTKKIGLLNYLKDLKQNGYLSNNAYKIAEENIDKLNIMEIYYEISKGNIPILHQSVMASTNRSVSGKNIRQSIVAPRMEDNNRDKIKKQKYFDSQIMSIFGSKTSKKIVEHPIDFPMDTIIEEDDEKSDVKDKLINAYNNPLGINMGLPIDENIYKSLSIHKSISKDINKKSSIKISNISNEDRNKNIKINMNENIFKKDSINLDINKNENENNIHMNLSKSFNKSSNTIPLNSISQDNNNNNLINNSLNNHLNNNNFNDNNMNQNNNNIIMPQNESINGDKSEDEDKDDPKDVPYSSNHLNNQPIVFPQNHEMNENNDYFPKNSDANYENNNIDVYQDNIRNSNNNNSEINNDSLSLNNNINNNNANISPIRDSPNNIYNINGKE